MTRIKIEIVADGLYDCQKGLAELMKSVVEDNEGSAEPCRSYSFSKVDYSGTCEIDEVDNGVTL